MVISEYRSYELPPDFPLLILDGESWRISPTRSANLHFHNCVEIGLCRSGRGKMIWNREEMSFQAGDVTLISPEVHHTTWSDAGTLSLWSYLFVDLEKIPGRDMKSPDSVRDLAASGGLFFHAGESPWAARLVEGIIAEMKSQEEGYRDCVRGLMLAFVTLALRQLPAESSRLLRENPVLMPALNWIRDHYASDFTVADLAARCHLSPTHFRRLFREQIGTTPLDYLHQVRINAGCSLLLNSAESVASIAGQVGYSSLSCFNRHFLRVMGEVPSRWRKTGEEPLRRSVLTFTGWTRAETTEEILQKAEGRKRFTYPGPPEEDTH